MGGFVVFVIFTGLIMLRKKKANIPENQVNSSFNTQRSNENLLGTLSICLIILLAIGTTSALVLKTQLNYTVDKMLPLQMYLAVYFIAALGCPTIYFAKKPKAFKIVCQMFMK